MRQSSQESRRKDASPGRRRSEENNEEKLSCLYIGNIDKRVDSQQLTQLFKKYGELQYCYLVYQPTSSQKSSKQVKVSRGYGFAKYVKYDDLIKAKEQLDGHDFNGRKIKVQVSKRNKPRQSTPGRYLGKKRQYSPHGHRNRGRSFSRSSSGSYFERRRRHERKQKHRKRYQRSRDRYERSRSRDRSNEHRRRRRSISEQQRQRRRQRP